MEVAVTAGAIRHAKLQSSHHHQQTDTQLFPDRMAFLSQYQRWCQRMEWHILVVQEQNRKWNDIQNCWQARQFLQNNIQYAKYAVRLSRKDLKILVGLLTGHNSLNRHLSLLKIAEDPMCPLCGEEYDTSLHLLGRCSALVGKWRKQFGNHFQVK